MVTNGVVVRYLSFALSLVCLGSVFAGAEISSGAEELFDFDQMQANILQTQKQLGARKEALADSSRKALLAALVGAYIAGVFSGDCSFSSLREAFKNRDWGFLSRVFLGAGLSLEELVVAFRALRDLYEVNLAEREFDRFLLDLISSVEAQQGLRDEVFALSGEEGDGE